MASLLRSPPSMSAGRAVGAGVHRRLRTGYLVAGLSGKAASQELKIDRLSVTDIKWDPDDEAIIRAIVQLAQAGCDHLQGWLVRPAVPADAFEACRRARSARLLERLGAPPPGDAMPCRRQRRGHPRPRPAACCYNPTDERRTVLPSCRPIRSCPTTTTCSSPSCAEAAALAEAESSAAACCWTPAWDRGGDLVTEPTSFYSPRAPAGVRVDCRLDQRQQAGRRHHGV